MCLVLIYNASLLTGIHDPENTKHIFAKLLSMRSTFTRNNSIFFHGISGYRRAPLMKTIRSYKENTMLKSMKCFSNTVPDRLVTLQYIPRNMPTVFALLCFVVVIHWLIFPYPPGLLHWHCGNLTIAPVPAKQPRWIWISTSCEIKWKIT